MSTAYTITIGYNSSHDKAAVAKKLRSVVLLLQENPGWIAKEVARLRPEISLESLESFVESYRPPVDDLTLQIRAEKNGLPAVIQLASSQNGARSRDLKEECRRAFCRLVLEEMHREGMEINLIVS